ncbi:MAG: MFS transporter [Candidatus Bathyarchaeota archaeon]|nr:MFS transporter [Candidatus Bathyarchaeota archaeon]
MSVEDAGIVESKRSGFATMLLFLASTHFILHVYTMLLPALLPTLRSELGVSLPQVSLLVSIPLLVQIVANIPAGVASDRFSGAVMAASFLANVAAAALIPASTNFLTLLIGFCLLAIGSTLYHPPGLKASSEVDPSRMNLALGAHIAAGSMGIAVGPIVLGLLMPIWGWRSSFYLWMPPTLMFAVVSYLYMRRSSTTAIVEPGPRAGDGLRSLLTADFLLVLLFCALVEAAFINFSTFIPTYFTEVRGILPSLTSIIFGLGPLVGIAGAFGGGAAGDRYGRLMVTAVLLFVISALLALVPLSPGVMASAAVYIIVRALFASSMPLLSAMIAANSGVGNRSLAFSAYFAVLNLAGAATTSATSLIVEAHGASMMFPISIAILVPAMGLILLLKHRSA